MKVPKTAVFVDTALWGENSIGPPSRIGREEVGAQLVAACCEKFSGWDVRFLRPNTGAETISQLVSAVPADALILFPYTYTKWLADKIARRFKGKIPIIYGGYHAGIGDMPAKILVEGLADFVIAGRGDTSLPQLLRDLADGKAPQARTIRHHDDYPKDGKYPLDRLPWPMRDENLLQDINREPLPFKPPATLEPNPQRCVIITGSLGCNARCDFCPSWMISATALHRSPKNIVDEMQSLQNRFGPGIVYMFADPLFNSDRDWMLALCKEMENRGPFPSICMPDFRLDREMVRAMKRAGVYFAMMGLEFTSNDVRKDRGKRAADPAIAFTLCSEEGIITRAFVMLGQLGTTREGLRQEIEALEALPFRADHLRINFEVPFPGTRVAQRISPDDIVTKDQALWTIEEPVYRTAIPHSELTEARLQLMRDYHFSPRQQEHYARQCARFPELGPVYEDFLTHHLGWYKEIR